MRHTQATSWEAILRLFAYASPFTFPLYLLRFEVFHIPFTIPEVFSYLFFSFFCLSVVFGKKIQWSKSFRNYYILTLLILIGAGFGALTAPEFIALPGGVLMESKRVALGVWKGWVLAPILYFFAFTQVISKADELKKILSHFIYSAALVGLFSYGFAVFGQGITPDLRLIGFFDSANYLALYIGPALLLGIYFLLNGSTNRSELYYLASVTILTHALLLSQSYAAIISVFGALFIYIVVLMVRHKMKLFKVFISFFILLITFGAIVGSQLNSSKFRQFLDFEQRSSTTVRLEIYGIALNLIQRYPLAGVGPGLFQGYYQIKGPDILGHAPMEWNIPHPHNIFLAFYLNAGILGLIGFLGMILLAHVPITYPVIALWGILIHGLFDTPFWKNDLAMIFWLIIGAILILQTYGTNSSQKPTNPIRKRTAPRHRSSARAKKITA